MPPAPRQNRVSTITPLPPDDLFKEIMRLYDIAENMIAAIEEEGIINREAQLELSRPLVTQITNSANIISAFYTETERNGMQVTPQVQEVFEDAFRNVVFAYREFLDGVEAKLLSQGDV